MSSGGFEPVRLGVVGLGHFGRLHARTLAMLAESRLVALVDRDAARVENIVTELKGADGAGPRGWVDLARALRESDAQAWVVASSTASHVEIAHQILAQGKTVLVEKPLAMDVASARSLATLVRPDSSNLMLGHIVLFNSETRQLLAKCAAMRSRGSGGRIRFMDAVRHRPPSTGELHPGESPLHLTMIHDLYVAQTLMGGAEPTGFRAHVARDAKGNDVLALAWLDWPDGTAASFAASFLTPPGMAGDGFDRMEVLGEGWAARVQTNPRPMEWWDERARWPMELEIVEGAPATGGAPPMPPTGMLAEELRCFCRVARGVEPVPRGATYGDALQVLGWLQRLEESRG